MLAQQWFPFPRKYREISVTCLLAMNINHTTYNYLQTAMEEFISTIHFKVVYLSTLRKVCPLAVQLPQPNLLNI